MDPLESLTQCGSWGHLRGCRWGALRPASTAAGPVAGATAVYYHPRVSSWPSVPSALAGLVRVSGWLEVSWGDAAPQQVQVTFSRLSGACSWADGRSQWEGSGELSSGG